MIELTQAKKNKVTLSDYNYKRDIENRLLIASFSPFELSVLEEILFSALRTQTRKMTKNLGCSDEEIAPVLEKLAKAGLHILEGDTVVVDKEMRKYFETEMAKFEADFIPDMEFLQNLLKKVPIHVLPLWYSIPRTSNNIFDSLVEKYLLTPQVFQRYLLELNFGDPALSAIAQDVFKSPQLSVPIKDLVAKYQLTPQKFEEYMLTLEFHFVCCRRKDEVTPFQEWKNYLSFLKTTTTPSITDTAKIKRYRPHDFSFVEDLSFILKKGARLADPSDDTAYIPRIQRKIDLLKLADVSDWSEMRFENRALYLYRHPHNKIFSNPSAEKLVRECEKSIMRVLHSGWVLFDDFIQGTIEPIGDHVAVSLKKCGKSWKYTLPHYTPEEKAIFHAVIFEWLFEAGITAIGTYDDKECFMVTPFGQSLFG